MKTRSLMSREYRTVSYVSGPLLFVERPVGASYGETARITLPDGETRNGQILDIFQSTTQLPDETWGQGIDVVAGCDLVVAAEVFDRAHPVQRC